MSDETKYSYNFTLWPSSTRGRGDDSEHHEIPKAVFQLFEMLKGPYEVDMTALEFVRFRLDVESFGIDLHEISRKVYMPYEPVA